jgi:hypothetical protein
MACNDEDHGRTRDGQAQVRYSVSMLCVIYTMHNEMRSVSFLV